MCKLVLFMASVSTVFILSCSDGQGTDKDNVNSDNDSSEALTDLDSSEQSDIDSKEQDDADNVPNPCAENPCNDLECKPSETVEGSEIYTGDFVCSDSDKDYVWSDINNNVVLIDSAKKYCKNLVVAGYDDWQLPTLNNLREIIKNCPANEISGGTCTQSIDSTFAESCEGCEKTNDGKYSKLGDTGCLWASRITPNIWYVDYKSAYIAGEVESGGTIAATHHCNARCVRYEIGSERKVRCKGPNYIKWNTANEITQTWNGAEWKPTNIGVYEENPSETECHYICENATYNSESGECECDPGYKDDNGDCVAIENPCDSEGWRCHDLECIPAETSPGSKLYTGTYSCYDSDTGNFWSRGFAKWNWDYTKAFCEDFNEGNFNDWRLPTILELRSLIKNCSNTETGGTCPITDETPFLEDIACGGCEYVSDGSYSKLGDRLQLWSSVSSGEAFLVDFSKASIYKDSPSFLAYPRCVREDISK